MSKMDDLKDMICMELEEIAKKGEMSPGDLDTVYKLIVSKEKLLRIEELEDDLGYSEGNGNWRAMGSYGNGHRDNSYYDGNSYNDGNSYANRGKHYVRGHYSRGRYSMAESKQMLMDQMREMMDDDTMSMSDKNAIKRAMEQLR